eukprot:11259794-Prorocentrum_lima.AAC.1
MTSSLVGSEMCIRDRRLRRGTPNHREGNSVQPKLIMSQEEVPQQSGHSVSYTHLTLPTICSV